MLPGFASPRPLAGASRRAAPGRLARSREPPFGASPREPRRQEPERPVEVPSARLGEPFGTAGLRRGPGRGDSRAGRLHRDLRGRQQPVDRTPRTGIRPRRDGEPHRPGGCGALSPPDGGPNRWRDPSRRLSRGGRTLPHPSPAALRVASAREGLSPQPARGRFGAGGAPVRSGWLRASRIGSNRKGWVPVVASGALEAGAAGGSRARASPGRITRRFVARAIRPARGPATESAPRP